MGKYKGIQMGKVMTSPTSNKSFAKGEK